MAEQGLFGLVVPLTCLVIGDAVLGADLRAGTFAFTWLSPVRFHTIAIARWLGGWVRGAGHARPRPRPGDGGGG